MKYYKAVKVVNGRMFSTFVQNELKVEYVLGEWISKPVEHPHYGLFTVTSYEGLPSVWGGNIETSIQDNGVVHVCGEDFELYECEVVPLQVEIPSPRMYYSPFWNVNDTTLVTNSYSEHKAKLVEKVKLVRKLSKDEILNLKKAYETL